MSQLGELLELMATARRRYRTLSATLHERFDEAIVERDEDMSPFSFATVSELFYASPDRLRDCRRGVRTHHLREQ